MNSRIAIVGAGAAGTLTAANLARLSGGLPQDITLIDAGPSPVATGIAYSTNDPAHLLNVRAGNMSAYPDDPADLTRWVTENGRELSDGGFLARRDYGAYLGDVLRQAERTRGVRLKRVCARVIDLSVEARGNSDTPLWRVVFDNGSTLRADSVVLASGNCAPSTAWAPQGLLDSSRFIADPWRPGALSAIGGDEAVLLVGSGLTMVDVALSLGGSARRMVAVSRHGMIPRAHTVDALAPMAVTELPSSFDLPTVRRWIGDLMRRSLAECGDWRPAIDGLRPVTQRVWQLMSDADRDLFLRDDIRRWEILRHRMAPAVAEHIHGLRTSGRLAVHADEVVGAVSSDEGVTVTLRSGREIKVGWVINCTGPASDLRQASNGLLSRLFDRGMLVPAYAGMGVCTDDDGRVLATDGSVRQGLWTLGSLRRGQLWESTAIPEIRVQAQTLAAGIVRAGRERAGQEGAGRDGAGQERAGRERAGRDGVASEGIATFPVRPEVPVRAAA